METLVPPGICFHLISRIYMQQIIIKFKLNTLSDLLNDEIPTLDILPYYSAE